MAQHQTTAQQLSAPARKLQQAMEQAMAEYATRLRSQRVRAGRDARPSVTKRRRHR